METIKKTTRQENTLKEIIHNFRCSITEIENFVNSKGYMRVVDKKEFKDLDNHIAINRSKLDFLRKGKDEISVSLNNNLTKSQRKHIAKRLWNVEKKPSRRSINTLFLVLRKFGVIKENIKIELSKKEQDIQRKRKIWLKLRNEAETALNNYKKEKGNFYK